MEKVAKHRMREIKMWSKLKKEFNDGSFNDKDSKTIKILQPNLNKNKQHKKLFKKHDNFYNKTIF